MADMKFYLILKADGSGNVTGQLKQVESAVKGVDGGTKNLTKSQQELGKETDKATGKLKEFWSITQSLKAGLAGLGIAVVARQIMTLHDQLVAFQRGLSAVSSGTIEAGKNMAFVTNLAGRLGMNINDLRKTFVLFAGSVKGTSLEGEAMRKIMEAMATTGKNLGLSGEAMQRAFVAVSQMAAKGVVSMEELRGQLGEAMPGALQAMARAMNMSMPDFIAFVSQGQALAEEVLPKWAAEMDKANQSTVNASSGFKTFAEVLTAISNEFQLFFENMTSSDLMAKSTGADWRAIVAGMLDLLNAMNDMMATSRKLAEHQKTVEGQWEAATAKLKELREEYNRVVTSYLTSREAVDALRVAIENQQRTVDLLKQTMEEAKVSIENFAGAQDWAAKATERANATLRSREALGIGGGASVALVEQVTNRRLEELKGYESYIDEQARLAGIEKNVIYSIILNETELASHWDKFGKVVRSPAGAIGIMQVMPDLDYLQKIGAGIKSVADLEDPFKNITAGIAVFQDKLKRANGDVELAMRYYNGAGREAEIYREKVFSLYTKLNAASGQQKQHTQAISDTTKAIHTQESAIENLKQAMSTATTQDQVARLKDEVQAREKLLDGLKDIERAEISLSDAQQKATQKFYELLQKNPITGEKEKEIALRDYVIKQTDKEIKAVQDAQSAYAQLQKDIKIDTAIDANVRALKDEKEALEAATKGAKDKAEAQDKLLETLDALLAKQDEYVKSLQKEAIAAQDELLKAQDPAAYKEYVRARERAVVVGKELISTYEQEALAALEARYAAEDALEPLRMRQGWAKSILEGFDQLWSNMISGAENAMEALQKTLKSWLFAIANWLLKQTLIIPVTAAMFGVSQQSLGGGLLGGAGGTGGSGGGILSGLSRIGSLFSSGSVAQGLNRFANWATGWANAGPQQNAIFGGANWGYGLAGAAGYYGAGALYGNKGYSGIGGSLGGMAGYGLTAAGTYLGTAAVGAITAGLGGGAMAGAIAGSVVPIIGTIIGAVAGGALGSMFGGGEKIKGGVGYWNPRQGAGAAHGDTDPAVVGLMGEFGKLADQFNTLINQISGRQDNLFGGGFWMDTNSKGQISTAYNSWLRGVQKASFAQQEQAAKWLAEQMMHDVSIALRNVGGGMDEALQGVFGTLSRQMTTDAEASLQALAEFAEKFPAIQQVLKDTLPKLSQPLRDEFTKISKWNAKSLGDVAALMTMAQDVQAGYADSLWLVFQGTQAIQTANEDLLSAYQRGAAQFVDWRAALVLLGGPVLRMTQDTIFWADQIAKAAGGLENLQALQSVYFENFYTEAERTAAAQKLAQVEVDKFNTTLGKTGDVAIDTRDELRAYIESLDLGTDAGRNAYVAALKLAEAIATLDPVATDAATALTKLFNSLSAYTAEQLKPGDNTSEQAAAFFENFYTEAEKAAAAMAEWNRQIADFNGSLGLSGDAAIDTKAELRAYIESLDLTTDAGKRAYVAAMQLVDALLGLEAAATQSTGSLGAIFDEIFNTGSVRQLVKRYMDAIESARNLGATADEVWTIAMQGLAELKAAAESFAQSVGTISVDEFVTKARQMILAAFEFGGFDVAIRYAEDLERALQQAIQAAIWKVIELKKAWEDFQISIEDRIGRLYEGPGVNPSVIWEAGTRMWNTFVEAWEGMDLEQRMSAVNTMLGYIDQWVSASIAHINDALNKQIEAINAAADAQLDAINSSTDALQEQRDALADYYSEQIDALQEILDGLGEWVNVIESLNSTMKSLRYGAQNPIPPGAQMAAMGAEIAKKMAEFRLAPSADLAEEIRALLEQRIGIASQVFQRSDARYIALYAQTMELLRELLAAAPDDSDRMEDIQKQIKDLTKEQNEVLKNLDNQIEAQRKATEAQTKAIEQSRDAQIKAAQAAAEAQRKAVYDTARQMYEVMRQIGNDVYRQMVEQGMRDIDIAKRTLNATHNMIVALVELYNVVAGTQYKLQDHEWRTYDTGTPYVPKTGPAILHQGERVMTVDENREYTHGKPTIVLKFFEGATISGDPTVIRRTVQDMIPVIKREIKRSL